MNITRILIAFGLTGLLAGGALSAAEEQSEQQLQQKREEISERWGLEIENIKDAAIPGLFEVMIGTQIIYLSTDGRFLLEGDIVDITTATRKNPVSAASCPHIPYAMLLPRIY